MCNIGTRKRQIVTFKVKNLRNNRKKNQQFRILTTIDSDGRVVLGIYPYSYLVQLNVIRSPVLPLISE